MKVVLFEDEYYIQLLPLVYFRPVWELRCGALSLVEKVIRYLSLSSSISFRARRYLEQYYLPRQSLYESKAEDVFFLNGAVVANPELAMALTHLPDGHCLVSNDRVVAFRDKGEIRKYLNNDGVVITQRVREALQEEVLELPVLRYLWDAIDHNGPEIERDFRSFARAGFIAGRVDPGVVLLEEQNMHIDTGAVIKPGVVLDAEEGPIWIDRGALIMPNSVITGPAYIGPESRIKIGAKIYPATSIGPVCKMGGEVEGSIIQGYANKQHDGFLGHAYLGCWVNLGADTNNSDLKNSYGTIRVMLNGREIDTGKRFLGLMMGDHSKTAINTMFNTGTIVGVSCNIFGAEMPPKFVPSFSWGGATRMVDYDLEKSIQVAKIVMERRKVTFGEKEERLFRAVYRFSRRIEKRG